MLRNHKLTESCHVDLLRRFPDSAQDIVPHLTASLDAVTTPDAVVR